MKTFQFIGEGRGVIGLPHKLTDIEAKRLGVEDVLKAAVANGSYEEVKESGKTATVLPAVENKPETTDKKSVKS